VTSARSLYSDMAKYRIRILASSVHGMITFIRVVRAVRAVRAVSAVRAVRASLRFEI